MRKPSAIIGLAVVASVVATAAFAEVSRPTVSLTAATNATAQTGATLIDRGILHKLEVNLSGAARTATVWVADSDGTVILSNSFVSGSTITNLADKPAVVGFVVTTANANTNGITVLVKPTLEK